MFNNGYNSFYPYYNTGARAGLLAGLRGRFNWGSILNNTQKTLNIVNQAIPLVYQVRPIVNNARTLFKVMGAVKDDGTITEQKNSNSASTSTSQNVSNNTEDNVNTSNNTSNTPNFFL